MGNLIRPDTLTTHFKAFLKRHNLPVIRLHELRHTCASILIACGVSMKAVQEWLGHSTFNTTADIYSHLNYSSKLGIEDTFSSVFGGKPTPIEQTSPGAMSKIQKIFYSSDVEAAPKKPRNVEDEYDSRDEDSEDVERYKRFAIVQFKLRKIVLTEFILRNFFFHLRDTSIFNFAFRHWRSITRRNADKM